MSNLNFEFYKAIIEKNLNSLNQLKENIDNIESNKFLEEAKQYYLNTIDILKKIEEEYSIEVNEFLKELNEIYTECIFYPIRFYFEKINHITENRIKTIDKFDIARKYYEKMKNFIDVLENEFKDQEIITELEEIKTLAEKLKSKFEY